MGDQGRQGRAEFPAFDLIFRKYAMQNNQLSKQGRSVGYQGGREGQHYHQPSRGRMLIKVVLTRMGWSSW